MPNYTFIELAPRKEAKILADYTSIEHDLKSSRNFAELYLTEYPKIGSTDLVDALMVAMIIRYARSFQGGVRSHLPKPAGILTKEQIIQHEFFMAVRDKYIAHSVNSYEECQLVARYWDHKVQTEGINEVGCIYTRVAGLSEQDARDIIGLVDTWLRHVNDKLRDEKSQLVTLIRKIPFEKLRQGSPGPKRLNLSQPLNRRRSFT